MPIDLAMTFEKDMRDCSFVYRRKTSTNPTRYLQLIAELGGIAAASKLALDPHMQSGLQKAAEYDCIELTSEYLIVHGQGGNYSKVFPEGVQRAAERKLKVLYEYRDVLQAAGMIGKAQ